MVNDSFDNNWITRRRIGGRKVRLEFRIMEERPTEGGSGVGVSTDDGTQTEGTDDSVDGFMPPHYPHVFTHNNNEGTEQSDGGFLSTWFSKALSTSRIRDGSEGDGPDTTSTSAVGGRRKENVNYSTIGTQTEEQDPISARGLELSYYLIQELSIGNQVGSKVKDDVYMSLTSCICDMLVKHSILFNGMIRRCQVTHYHVFDCIANEIFEVNEAGQFRITWGRIISLFAFAVRLAQEYREDPVQVDSIIRFLSLYLMKHLVTFIRANGGWEGLVEHFPPPVDEDAQVKRAMLWSGLCVGLVATMYISSMLSSR